MNDLQLQIQLKQYTIKSSFSEPPSPEEPSPSPHTFQRLPRIYPSTHWYANPQIMKTSAQGLIHHLIMAPSPLTTAALLTLLLAGFTLMALFAYSSPIPSPATLHSDPTINLGNDPSAPVISKSASAHHAHSTSAPGILTIHTDPGMISAQNRAKSNSTHSNIDSQGSQRGPSGSNGEHSAPGNWDTAFAEEVQEAQREGGRIAPANSEVHGGGVH